MTRFQVVSPLVAQDWTEALESFHWESFEIWLDTHGGRLARCFWQEARATAQVRHNGVESSDTSTPLLYLSIEREINLLSEESSATSE